MSTAADGGPHLEPHTVAQALRLLRDQAQLTRAQVAEAAGISERTLSRYERGDTARADIVSLRALCVTYARALGITSDQLWRELTALIDRHYLSTQILEAEIEILGSGRRRTASTDEKGSR